MSCVFTTILELQKKQNELKKAKIAKKKIIFYLLLCKLLKTIRQVAQLVCVLTNDNCSVHFCNTVHSKDRERNIKSRSARKITRAV